MSRLCLVVVLYALIALLVPSLATARTEHCRVAKPARATKGGSEVTLKIGDLVERNVRRDEAVGGKPCEAANWLAWEYEYAMTSREAAYEEAPEVLVLYGWHERPPTEWRVRDTSFHEDGPECERWTTTFRHGRQQVAMRVVEELQGKPCDSERLTTHEETLSPCEEEELQGTRAPQTCPDAQREREEVGDQQLEGEGPG